MKQGHFAMIALFMVVYAFFGIFAERETYRQVQQEKERMEESLLIAVEKTTETMKQVLEEQDEVQLLTLEEEFFESWFIQLGISDKIEEQERMRLHVPMIAWLLEEGGYFYYTEEVSKNGTRVLEPKWSRLIPYSTGNEITKDEVIVWMEQQATTIINEHNRIAVQFGIEYQFFVPYFLGAQPEVLSFPIVVVVFQGWPLKVTGDLWYENCVDASAYIKEKEKYLIELSGEEERYHYIHKKECEYILKKENLIQEPLFLEEARKKYGTMMCPYCFENDIYPTSIIHEKIEK